MDTLVDELVKDGRLNSEHVIKAFRAIDRADFVAPGYEGQAYVDTALPIGEGQTISQPTVVALMLEMLAPRPGEKILDVGSGSGWTTALLAHCIGRSGRVIGVELVPELVVFGRNNLAKYDLPHATISEAGDVMGNPDEAPYDKILVSAAASRAAPDDLVRQLAAPGAMVIPVQSAIVRIARDAHGNESRQRHEGFAFVPLHER